jgi:hypothetical protein
VGRLAVLALLSLTVWLAVQAAAAHGVIFGDLRGARLCVEPESVRVRLVGAPTSEEASAARLSRFLARTLESARVPHTRQEACGDGFTAVSLAATWLEPEASDPLYIYSASVQVGPRPAQLPGDPELLLPDGRFYHLDSSLFLESDLDQPFEEAVLSYAEGMIADLAGQWWADELARRREVNARLLGLGAAALALTLAGLWRLRTRRPRAAPSRRAR